MSCCVLGVGLVRGWVGRWVGGWVGRWEGGRTCVPPEDACVGDLEGGSQESVGDLERWVGGWVGGWVDGLGGLRR